MSPNCTNCDDGAHGNCLSRYEGDCQCATGGHRGSVPSGTVDQETGVGIPNYAILDLWMALGNEPGHEFDDAIAVRGKADVWAYLLSAVRALNARGRIEATKPERGDPLFLRAKAALDEMLEITEVETDVDMDDVITDSRGRIVHGTLRSILRVTGRLS